MLSYYKILGVEQHATSGEIKKAYKVLALKYHPDKNGGNKEFEELFKLVNTSYQVLIDPIKRKRHDLEISYVTQTNKVYSHSPTPSPKEEKSVYNRYGKYNWRNAPQYKRAAAYKIDKYYYRNIVLSLLAMVIMSGIILTYFRINQKIKAEEKAEREATIAKQIELAQDQFDNDNYREALIMIEELIRKFPVEYQFSSKRNEFIDVLNELAIHKYQEQSFASAISTFTVLTDFQTPVRIDNWKMLAECYLKTNELKKAAQIYEYIAERDHENLTLNLKLADLYNKIGNKEKELDYYNEARYLFKKFQESSYGPAFEFIIDPEEMPETYYNMFQSRANLLFEKGDMENVVKDCNWGIFLRPERAELYYLRAQARARMNQINRSCNDIKRAIQRGFSKNNIKINIDCDYL